ncbi:MAG: hypothetical protein CUN55_13360 [Phototrophicales bacterium]|nr:MAG: hypothetical protein CUN55_13360 [Phototrophicales bacterium]
MSQSENPIPELRIEHINEGRITVVAASSTNSASIEAGFEFILNEIQNWPDLHTPYLLLLDMSRVMLTPYVRRKAIELAQVRPEVAGRTAIVISASTIGHLIRVFVNNSLEGSRERQVFFAYDKAIEWLEELL